MRGTQCDRKQSSLGSVRGESWVDKAEVECTHLLFFIFSLLLWCSHSHCIHCSWQLSLSLCNALLVQVSSRGSHWRWSLPRSTQSPETVECNKPRDVGVSKRVSLGPRMVDYSVKSKMCSGNWIRMKTVVLLSSQAMVVHSLLELISNVRIIIPTLKHNFDCSLQFNTDGNDGQGSWRSEKRKRGSVGIQ